MIKKYFIALAALVLGTASVAADDNLYIENLTMNAGETKNVEVVLENTSAVQSLGMYITLPEGVTVDAEKVALVTSRASEENDTIAARFAANECRVAMLGFAGKAVEGTSGALFTIPVTVAAGTAAGEYEITLSNVELSTTENKVINQAETKVTLTVTAGLTGDVNGDGTVNIEDVTAIISVICGDPTYAEKSDVNGDGSVNIEDVTAVINIICGN